MATISGSRLAGKVTIITGAASGLGRVAAIKFASEGASIVISDVTDGTKTVEEIKANGGKAEYIKADVTSEDSWRDVVDFAKKTFGSVDVLYNNAGVMLGDDDEVTLEHAIDVYRSLPAGELAIIPGTSHGLMIEKPSLCNAILLDFLTNDPVTTLAPVRRRS